MLARVPEAPERLAREVVGFVHRLREADLTKVPGIAETLDWAAALLSLGARELAPELVDETLGVVLKYEEDIRQVRGEQAAPDARRGRRGRLTSCRPARPTPRSSKAPFGPEVDGRRLLGEAVGFGGRCGPRGLLGRPRRGGRLRPGPDPRRHRRPRAGPRRPARRSSSAAATTARSTTRSSTAGGGDARSRLPGDFEPPPMPDPHDAGRGRRRGARRRPARGRRRAREPGPGRARHPDPVRQATTPTTTAPIEGVVIAPDAYSQGEVLRHREFDRMTPAELREAERLVDLLVPAPRAAPDAPLRAPLARPPPRAAGDVPAQPRDRRPARRRGSGGGRSASRARWSSCATSRARWSATRGCCCGSSRRCRRPRRSGPSRSCSGRG